MTKLDVENKIKTLCSSFEGNPFTDKSWSLISSHLEMCLIDLIYLEVIHSYRIVLKEINKYFVNCYLFIRFLGDDFYYPYTLKIET